MRVSIKTLKILSQELDHEVSVNFVGKKNLRDLLIAHKISIGGSCGGFGTCTSCRVEIIESPKSFSSPTLLEQERATERGFISNERLSCQMEILDDAKIKIPSKSI